MDANRFASHSLTDSRIQRILSAVFTAIDPVLAVKRYLPTLSGNVYGFGVGKASIPMLTALAESYPLSGALAISKHASSSSDPSHPLRTSLFPVIQGGHPVPNLDSLHAGERALEFVSGLQEDDTLVCLISGGGSALMTAPYVPLEDMQTLTSMLLACGARIDEINILRRQLDKVKGGWLARATKAKVVSLILSDVIGNPLEAIASGPTYPNPTTNVDAIAVLKKYGIEEKTPRSIIEYLNHGILRAHSDRRDSPDANKRSSVSQVTHIIVGDNELASRFAMAQAQREGFDSVILTNQLQGEARDVGVMLANQLREETTKRTRPFCLIAGGETTVTIKGDGIGGRNQELALATVDVLREVENVMLISLATDGEDGPTDAAGAVVTGESARRGEMLGIFVADYLSKNDAYHYFQKMNDLIRIGPSGTNVNDLVFLLAL